MLSDSGWEAQRPFKAPGKDRLKRMPGMPRNPSRVCQRQQEADVTGDGTVSYVFKIIPIYAILHRQRVQMSAEHSSVMFQGCWWPTAIQDIRVQLKKKKTNPHMDKTRESVWYECLVFLTNKVTTTMIPSKESGLLQLILFVCNMFAINSCFNSCLPRVVWF